MSADDRRLLLALVLCLLVLMGYQFFLAKKYPPVQPSGQGLPTDTGMVEVAHRPDTSAPALVVPISPVEDLPASFLAESEETTVLRTGEIEVITTTRGAGIRQLRLLGIPRLPHKDARDVILVDEEWPEPAGGIILPRDVSSKVFKMVHAQPDRVQYVYEQSFSGRAVVRIERTISLSVKKYEVRVETRIKNMSPQLIQFGTDSSTAFGIVLAPFPKKGVRTDLDIHELFVKLGSDVEHWAEERPGFFDNLFGREKKEGAIRHETLDGVLRWISIGDRYFTVTLIPDSPLARANVSMNGPAISAVSQAGSFSLDPQEEESLDLRIYAGPKTPAHLRSYGADLLEIMKFGWFDWLGFWMLRLMNLFHLLIPNYGAAIILLTCVVRIVLYPLTYKSYVSMAKLKELTPKMKAIQEKYKDNKEKLNRELMKMYKDNKVNPAGGCLPILLQIPVFIAFYNMLQYTIELRGASFMWVKDLSVMDPYYILPILMGVSMLIQQKLTPTPDPNQAKIGMVMTVVFTFLFLSFPAGLNLYWFVSTALGIIQQKMIERKLTPAAPAPAAS